MDISQNFPQTNSFARSARRGTARLLVIFTSATILAGITVKFVRLDHQSFGFDEIITYLFSQRDLTIPTLWSRFWAYDVHPPFYYATVHFWLQLFERADEVVLRSLSAAFAAAASMGALLAYRHLLPWPGRLLFVTFVSCNFGLIFYAQEARQYSLLFLLALLLLAAMLTVWKRLHEERRLSGPALAACAVVGVLLSFTHLFGMLYAAACFLTMFILLLIYQRGSIALFIAIAAVTGVVAVAWPLWALVYLNEIKELNSTDWLRIYLDPLYLGRLTAWLLFGNPYALALAILVGVGALCMKPRTGGRRVPAAVYAALAPSVLVLVAAAAVSVVFFPLLSHRNLMVLFPSIYFAITALVITRQTGRFTVAMSASFGVLLLWPTLSNYYEPHKTQWRESAAYIADDRGCSGGTVRFFPPMLTYGGTLLHSVYLPGTLQLRPARVEAAAAKQRTGDWQLTDLSAVLGEAAEVAENNCDVLLWVIPSNWIAGGLSELEIPEGIAVKEFFEAAVFVREQTAGGL